MKIKDKVLIVEDEQSISNFISRSSTIMSGQWEAIMVRASSPLRTMMVS